MWPNLTSKSVVLCKEPCIPSLKDDGSNKRDFFVACILDGQDFGLNYGGHPRSDIALINQQSDLRVAENLLNRLQQLPNPARSEKFSDSDLVSMVRSKYAQTASESIRYLEHQLELRDLRKAARATVVDSPGVKSSDNEIIDKV